MVDSLAPADAGEEVVFLGMRILTDCPINSSGS
jgi:hypothetical protein